MHSKFLNFDVGSRSIPIGMVCDIAVNYRNLCYDSRPCRVNDQPLRSKNWDFSRRFKPNMDLIMSHETCYYWIVICKNHRFHNRQNQLFGHKILLAETDGCSAMPVLDGRFTVRCDDCGQEYSYKSKNVWRLESDYTGDFRPHPLFVTDFPPLSVPNDRSAPEASSPGPEVASISDASLPAAESKLNSSPKASSRDLLKHFQRLRATLSWCVQRAQNILPRRPRPRDPGLG